MTQRRILYANKDLSMKEIIKKEGWNTSLYYLKWEVCYTMPHLALNKGKVILISRTC